MRLKISSGAIASVVSTLVGLITIYQFFVAPSSKKHEIPKAVPSSTKVDREIIPTASFIQILPRFRDARNIILEPDSDYFAPPIDCPKPGAFFSAVIQRPIYKSSLSDGKVSDSTSLPTKICFERIKKHLETGKEGQFVVFDCKEKAGCNIQEFRNPGWVQVCSKQDAESISKWDGKDRTDKSMEFVLKFKLLSSPNVEGQHISWLPDFVSNAYAIETPGKGVVGRSWSVPSLETLRGMTDRERDGYTEFKISTGSLSHLPKLREADSYTFMIWINGTPAFIDAWPKEYLRKTFDVAKGIEFAFGLENLDFTGAQKGYEKITVLFEFRRGNQLVESLKVSRDYAALRDAPVEKVLQNEILFNWAGKYIKPKKQNTLGVVFFSTDNLPQAKKWQNRIAGAKLSFKNQPAVGVIRPPVRHSGLHSVVVGLRQENGPIKFTFNKPTANTILHWLNKSFSTEQEVKVTDIIDIDRPKVIKKRPIAEPIVPPTKPEKSSKLEKQAEPKQQKSEKKNVLSKPSEKITKTPAPDLSKRKKVQIKPPEKVILPVGQEKPLAIKKSFIKSKAKAWEIKGVPRVKLNVPKDNKTKAPMYKLSGSISAEVKKAFVAINGNNTQPLLIINGRFEIELPMIRGNNYIEVQVISLRGITYKESLNLLYTPSSDIPYVNLSSPKNGPMHAKQGNIVVVQGTVDDPSVKEAILFFNGVALPPIPVINYSFRKKVVVFDSRVNTFQVRVKNRNEVIGNSDLRTVIYPQKRVVGGQSPW